jgi:hypothetical protein
VNNLDVTHLDDFRPGLAKRTDGWYLLGAERVQGKDKRGKYR